MRILICVDKDLQIGAAVQFGSMVAEALAGGVTLLHVIQDENGTTAVEKRLAQIGAQVPVDEMAVRIRRGTAVSEIVDECRTGDHDMIVVGAPTVSGMLGHLLPSVSQAVAEKAPVSVIVATKSATSLKQMLICSSGQPMSRSVVEAGAQLAEATGASVRMLHVADPVPQMYTGLNTMDETASALLASDTPVANELRWAKEMLTARNIPTDVVLHRGIVVDEIVQETLAETYDLVVLGAPQRQTLWQNLLMGKVTPRVIEQSPCPVMVVRS